jgi:hypothetical protein
MLWYNNYWHLKISKLMNRPHLFYFFINFILRFILSKLMCRVIQNHLSLLLKTFKGAGVGGQSNNQLSKKDPNSREGMNKGSDKVFFFFRTQP